MQLLTRNTALAAMSVLAPSGTYAQGRFRGTTRTSVAHTYLVRAAT